MRSVLLKLNAMNNKYINIIKKTGKKLFYSYIAKIISVKILKKTYKYKNIKCIVNFIFEFKLGFPYNFNMKPIQIKNEISELLFILKKQKPKCILEIGTAGGGTLFLFCKIASSSATIISVDLSSSLHGYPEWKIPIYTSFASTKQKIHLLKMDSHKVDTLNIIYYILNDQKVDFLFIDGDHSYSGVKRDYEMYSPLVRRGGIIAFHDIVPDYNTKFNIRSGADSGEVYKFWDEIKNNLNSIEIIKNSEQDGCGIGIIKT